MRILAVDDDESTLEILSILSARLGFAKMAEAANAKEAMESIRHSPVPYDCILLDLHMPGMNGIELCARLREHADYARCPIIMVTAMTDEARLDQACKAGADDYIIKPFNLDDLATRLDRVVRPRQGAAH
ncbi:PleD family two-component system response regulator [Marivita sp. S0852]|uniref:response regulator n=1 Tax=Marivita sp. S0852 TaxID=3373893 RepID=UPI003982594A